MSRVELASDRAAVSRNAQLTQLPVVFAEVVLLASPRTWQHDEVCALRGPSNKSTGEIEMWTSWKMTSVEVD